MEIRSLWWIVWKKKLFVYLDSSQLGDPFSIQGYFRFFIIPLKNKLRQHRPKRTGCCFLSSFFPRPFIWTAQAGAVSAQAEAHKNWALAPGSAWVLTSPSEPSHEQAQLGSIPPLRSTMEIENVQGRLINNIPANPWLPITPQKLDQRVRGTLWSKLLHASNWSQ
jgi:hypothetical protein